VFAAGRRKPQAGRLCSPIVTGAEMSLGRRTAVCSHVLDEKTAG